MHGHYPTSMASTLVLVATVSCGGSLAAPGDSQTTGRVATLIEALTRQGATAVSMERVTAESYCLSVRARRLVVNGENVYAFEYDSPQAAGRDAAGISPDASSITAAGQACMPAWTGPPRFYRQDRLIVLYVGADQNVISVLDTVLGGAFAHR
jgi:hypothetical protein